jgi:hypothetical protein
MNLFRTSSTLILIAGILAVAGCSSHTSTSTNINASAAADIYLTNQTSGGGSQTPQVLGISATGSSGATISTVNGPAGDTFLGLASDSSGNLFTVDKAAAGGAYTVVEFAAGTNSSGTSASTTIRTFTSTAINAVPIGLKVDGSGDIFVMLTGGAVLRFATGATGAVTPSASLTGSSGVMTTDSSGNLYVTTPISLTDNHSAIAVYSSGFATGAVAQRTILPATEMSITSLAVDSSGNIYATGKDINSNIDVAVFAAAATGTSTATRIISGANTDLVNPWQVQVDGAGNVFVADSTTGASGGTVVVSQFASTASGNIGPASRVTTSATYAATSAMTIH